jgi:hypothetical protein
VAWEAVWHSAERSEAGGPVASWSARVGAVTGAVLHQWSPVVWERAQRLERCCAWIGWQPSRGPRGRLHVDWVAGIRFMATLCDVAGIGHHRGH